MDMTIVMRNVNQVRNNDIECNHIRKFITTKLFTKFKWLGSVLKIDLLLMEMTIIQLLSNNEPWL